MTRINTIPPQALTDQHLLGEYNEILRPVKLCLKRLNKDSNKEKDIKDLYSDVPEHFKLGSGHVKFFYDKLQYLYKRLTLIKIEMQNRDFKASKSLDISELPEYLCKDWRPSESDRRIIANRLKEKILASDITWRYYGKPIDLEYFDYLESTIKERHTWAQGYDELTDE